MAPVSQEGNPVVPSWTRDKPWVSGGDPGVLLTTNVKNLGGLGGDFEGNRREGLGWIPSHPFFPLIMRSFWVIVRVEPSRGKQQHSCRGLQEFILGFRWHLFLYQRWQKHTDISSLSACEYISFPYASSLAVCLISWVTCFSSSVLLPSPGADPENVLKEKVLCGGEGDLICIMRKIWRVFTRYDDYIWYPVAFVSLEVIFFPPLSESEWSGGMMIIYSSSSSSFSVF